MRLCEVGGGDYASNPFFRERLGLLGLDYYARAFATIGARLREPTYFVFSDDPAWARSHIAAPGRTKIIDPARDRSDVEDLRLMSRCKHFVIANSSFSWWAAWLGQRPDSMVIAPSRWFNCDESPSTDRIPDSWIRL